VAVEQKGGNGQTAWRTILVLGAVLQVTPTDGAPRRLTARSHLKTDGQRSHPSRDGEPWIEGGFP